MFVIPQPESQTTIIGTYPYGQITEYRAYVRNHINGRKENAYIKFNMENEHNILSRTYDEQEFLVLILSHKNSTLHTLTTTTAPVSSNMKNSLLPDNYVWCPTIYTFLKVTQLQKTEDGIQYTFYSNVPQTSFIEGSHDLEIGVSIKPPETYLPSDTVPTWLGDPTDIYTPSTEDETGTIKLEIVLITSSGVVKPNCVERAWTTAEYTRRVMEVIGEKNMEILKKKYDADLQQRFVAYREEMETVLNAKQLELYDPCELNKDGYVDKGGYILLRRANPIDTRDTKRRRIVKLGLISDPDNEHADDSLKILKAVPAHAQMASKQDEYFEIVAGTFAVTSKSFDSDEEQDSDEEDEKKKDDIVAIREPPPVTMGMEPIITSEISDPERAMRYRTALKKKNPVDELSLTTNMQLPFEHNLYHKAREEFIEEFVQCTQILFYVIFGTVQRKSFYDRAKEFEPVYGTPEEQRVFKTRTQYPPFLSVETMNEENPEYEILKIPLETPEKRTTFKELINGHNPWRAFDDTLYGSFSEYVGKPLVEYFLGISNTPPPKDSILSFLTTTSAFGEIDPYIADTLMNPCLKAIRKIISQSVADGIYLAQIDPSDYIPTDDADFCTLTFQNHWNHNTEDGSSSAWCMGSSLSIVTEAVEIAQMLLINMTSSSTTRNAYEINRNELLEENKIHSYPYGLISAKTADIYPWLKPCINTEGHESEWRDSIRKEVVMADSLFSYDDMEILERHYNAASFDIMSTSPHKWSGILGANRVSKHFPFSLILLYDVNTATDYDAYKTPITQQYNGYGAWGLDQPSIVGLVHNRYRFYQGLNPTSDNLYAGPSFDSTELFTKTIFPGITVDPIEFQNTLQAKVCNTFQGWIFSSQSEASTTLHALIVNSMREKLQTHMKTQRGVHKLTKDSYSLFLQYIHENVGPKMETELQIPLVIPAYVYVKGSSALAQRTLCKLHNYLATTLLFEKTEGDMWDFFIRMARNLNEPPKNKGSLGYKIYYRIKAQSTTMIPIKEILQDFQGLTYKLANVFLGIALRNAIDMDTRRTRDLHAIKRSKSFICYIYVNIIFMLIIYTYMFYYRY